MTQAQNTQAIGFDVLAINKAAGALAVADKQFEMAIPQAASAVAKVLGTKPGYDLWGAVSDQFLKMYRDARGCEEKTAANRWSAVCTYMRENFELEKPIKPTEGAKKKQAARAKHEKAVKTARAQCVKPADAFAKAAELVAAGKVAEAKVYTEAGHALAKEAQDKANKAVSEQVKKLRETVRAELAKCADAALLQAALDLIRNGLAEQAKPKKESKPRRVKAEKAAA